MDYIKRCIDGVFIVSNKSFKENKGLVSYIQELCLNDGSSMNGRIEFSKHLLQSKSKVPFFVSEDILLVPTHSIRNYDCALINLFNVCEVRKSYSGLKLSFVSGNILEVSISRHIWMNQLQKANALVDNYAKRKCLHYGLIDRFYYENLV